MEGKGGNGLGWVEKGIVWEGWRGGVEGSRSRGRGARGTGGFEEKRRGSGEGERGGRCQP